MITEYRYRFKGRFSDKTRKIAVEKLEDGKVVKSLSIPHPKKMFETIELDTKNVQEIE
jgi:hypothetical protein